MTPATDFDKWLSAATRKLAPDGVERIRAEIGEHYQYTVASGATPEHAIAALGDPKKANRDYRRVFLTESEARFAASTATRTANDKPFALPAWFNFATNAGMALVCLMSTYRWMLWIWVPMAAVDIVQYFFPASTPLGTRLYQVVRLLGFPWMAWQWYAHDFLLPVLGGILALGCLALYANALDRRVKRKLAGKPAPALVQKLLPGEHLLTRTEAVFLRFVTRGEPCLRSFMIPVTAGLAFGAYFLPLMFGGLTALMALRFVLPFAINLYSSTRSHWFFKAKLTLFILAVILPLFQFLIPVPFHNPSRLISGGLVVNAAFVALFLSIEWTKYRFRCKLPAAEWPKELYL